MKFNKNIKTIGDKVIELFKIELMRNKSIKKIDKRDGITYVNKANSDVAMIITRDWNIAFTFDIRETKEELTRKLEAFIWGVIVLYRERGLLKKDVPYDIHWCRTMATCIMSNWED